MSPTGTEALTREELRRAYACFPSGVVTLCALDDDVPQGVTASSFTSVSLDPPLVSVCMQYSSTTWPVLRRRPRLGVSILAEGQDAIGRALSLRTGERFAAVDWIATPEGAVFVAGASAWLDCTVTAELPAGDHQIVLLRVDRLPAVADRPPLVFHGSTFRRLAALPWGGDGRD